MNTTPQECMACGQDILVVEALLNGNKYLLYLQPGEVEVVFDVSDDGRPMKMRGYERHWKYCPSRPQTGTESAPPPPEGTEKLP